MEFYKIDPWSSFSEKSKLFDQKSPWQTVVIFETSLSLSPLMS
jgi:hypothetical protein